MWNRKGALLACLIASAGTATAMPDCKGDWEHQAMLGLPDLTGPTEMLGSTVGL